MARETLADLDLEVVTVGPSKVVPCTLQRLLLVQEGTLLNLHNASLENKYMIWSRNPMKLDNAVPSGFNKTLSMLGGNNLKCFKGNCIQGASNPEDCDPVSTKIPRPSDEVQTQSRWWCCW